jgi:hypothetical protein
MVPEHASRRDVIGGALECADVDDRRVGHVVDEGVLIWQSHLGPPSVWRGVLHTVNLTDCMVRFMPRIGGPRRMSVDAGLAFGGGVAARLSGARTA